MRRVEAVLAALVALAPAPGWAVQLASSVPGAPDPGATGGLVIDFEGALPAGIAFTADSSYSILQGLVAHQGYNPAGDGTHYLSVPGSHGPSGSATLDFSDYAGPQLGDFSLYWGSIDQANVFTVQTSLDTFQISGATLISKGYGSATSASGNRRVGFSLASDEVLKSITFSSPVSFEVDDIVFDTAPMASVPEPASWALFVVGFGACGVAARRRCRTRARFV